MRDGQGVLLTTKVNDDAERIVVKSGGLNDPIRYISDSLAVVRVATSSETADYIVNIESGKMAKIVDVSNIGINGSYGY